MDGLDKEMTGYFECLEGDLMAAPKRSDGVNRLDNSHTLNVFSESICS
jgi:hypothetical protein